MIIIPECPVCMEIAKPPIYQCEEGHIICCKKSKYNFFEKMKVQFSFYLFLGQCKPLLTNCPHNCGKNYSEPAIRCRFAEKLGNLIKFFLF